MEPAVQKQTRRQEGVTLSTSVEYLKGVGPARAEIFGKLGVHTVADLLEYFPRDWVFAPGRIEIGRMKPQEQATIIGLVESIDYREHRRPPLFEAIVSDETGVCRGGGFP